MDFYVIDRDERFPSSAKSCAYLMYDRWNDFNFVTMFHVIIYDDKGAKHDMGNVKIGFKGQDKDTSTMSRLEKSFTHLGNDFFSLGTNVEYYSIIANEVPDVLKSAYLKSLRDLAADPDLLESIRDEEVFSVSLLRGVSLSSVKQQFARILQGGAVRTNYSFLYEKKSQKDVAGIELEFYVEADSTPSSNIHALIGRNGIGKTTILNGMIRAATGQGDDADAVYHTGEWGDERVPVTKEYFSSVLSVSFSAFDPFNPPPDQPDPAKGTCFYYVGLKKPSAGGYELKGSNELQTEFGRALKLCVHDSYKRVRWLKALKSLASDDSFARMGLIIAAEKIESNYIDKTVSVFSRLSSGHAIVLLTIVKLIERVEEKTLVLLDEPESHLHPPLLSAFIRALNDLLLERNGVAVIATHSPVVLQEIPASCVWKVSRAGLVAAASRPSIETFGENVGVLTREVFGLEVELSGFHTILKAEVEQGASFDKIFRKFGGQLGYEAQAILRALIVDRDAKAKS
ncbi:AAA family ATPase [Pseudomonas sp. PS01300]|uniref:AAA family ATPase n=1 Tax=Pseudomonas sp. PS01300 TaxID=2991436 RepID=UPI00249BCCFB|nr:AAA family ATPase [Pseudomonas sp. PS01300]